MICPFAFGGDGFTTGVRVPGPSTRSHNPTVPSAIRVGMSASLTGQFSRFGRQALAGAQLWAANVNASGGLRCGKNGDLIPVAFRYYDDRSEAQGAETVTRRLLADDRVHVLLGPYSSVLTKAAAAVAEEFGVPLWNHGGAADGLYERGHQWIIGVLSPASTYFGGLVELARRVPATQRKLALIGGGSPFPAAVLRGAQELATAVGFELVLRGNHRSGGPDQLALLTQLGEVSPDLLLIAGSFEQDVRLVQALAEAKLKPPLVGAVAAGVGAFGERLGVAAMGYCGPSQWEPPVRWPVEVGPSPQTAARRLRQETGHVDYPGAQAFAAGLIAQHCVETGRTLDPDALRRIAGELNTTTFFGRFQIDPTTGRQIGHQVVIVQWDATSKRLIWPANSD